MLYQPIFRAGPTDASARRVRGAVPLGGGARRVRRRRGGDGADRAARALRAARGRARAAGWGACVSVNISARQLADPDFTAGGRGRADALGRAAGRAAAGGDRVGDDAGPGGTRAMLADLRDRSASSAHLDDFGTGASSLRFLHRFPGGALKVDRSLVIGMLTDAGSHAIVKAVVGLAHNLGMEVVGEGVESAAHLDALPRSAVEPVQGFHLSPPLTAEAAAHMLTGRAPPSRARRRRCCRRQPLAALGVADVVRDPVALEAALVLPALLVVGAGRRRASVSRRSSTPSRSSSRPARRGRGRPSCGRRRRGRPVSTCATSANLSRSLSSTSSSSAMPRSCIVARSLRRPPRRAPARPLSARGAPSARPSRRGARGPARRSGARRRPVSRR